MSCIRMFAFHLFSFLFAKLQEDPRKKVRAALQGCMINSTVSLSLTAIVPMKGTEVHASLIGGLFNTVT